MAPSALSFAIYQSDGATQTYAVPFPFLSRGHIKVFLGWEPLDNTFDQELTEGTDFTWQNDGEIRLATPAPNGTVVAIVRVTPSSEGLALFHDGSYLIARDLNLTTRQVLYATQEAIDRARTTGEVALQAQADVAGAVAQAAAADAKANTAVADASAAQAAASQAQSDAAGAVSAAGAATSAANDATAAASTATSTANTALSVAGAANSKADIATSEANAASSKADQAIDAVSSALPVTIVANVAAIPNSPQADELVEVGNSTGIEGFSPLTGLPGGFTGDAGLRVRIQWNAGGNTWEYRSYSPNDPDSRYLKPPLPTASTSEPGIVQLSSSTNSTATNQAATPSAAKAAYDRGTQGVNAAAAAQSTADGAATAAAAAQSTADGAQSTADSATTLANAAGNAALAADTKAGNAQSTANAAQSTAQNNQQLLTLTRNHWPAGDRNLLMNGDFQFSMWNSNNYSVRRQTSTIERFACDRWCVDANTGDTELVATQIVPCGHEGLLNSIRIKCHGIYSPSATTYVMLSQYVEDQRFRWTRFGGSAAIPLQLSFYARNNTGSARNFNVLLRNSDYTRHCVFPFVLGTAGSGWQRFAFSVPPDTVGPYNTGGTVQDAGYNTPKSGIGLGVHIMLASGGNYTTGTTGAWLTSGNPVSRGNNQDNLFSSTSNEVEFSGFQLEPGSIITPYQFRDITDEERLLSRFGQQRKITIRGLMGNAGNYAGALHYVWEFTPNLRDSPWFYEETAPPAWADRVASLNTVAGNRNARTMELQLVGTTSGGESITYLEGIWKVCADFHRGLGGLV